MKIQLTEVELAELRSRAIPRYGEGPTIANYWQQLFASRSIKWPKGKIPVTVASAIAGEFHIEWHSRALGPAAIAAGKHFRDLHEHKDREWERKQTAQRRA